MQDIKTRAQKQDAFLHANDEQTEKVIQKTIPLITATKRIKCLAGLTKRVKHVYSATDNRWVGGKSLQAFPTLCNAMKPSLSGFSVHGVSRQEYWNRLPCPPPGNLPNPGAEPEFLSSPVLAGGFFATSAAWEANS